MQLNFTLNCVLDIHNQKYTAKVVSVVDASDEDITRSFVEYCRQASIPLSSEEEIRNAAYAYGKKFYG